jgi:hypothetical protein
MNETSESAHTGKDRPTHCYWPRWRLRDLRAAFRERTQRVADRLHAPSALHFFGTDVLGATRWTRGCAVYSLEKACA